MKIYSTYFKKNFQVNIVNYKNLLTLYYLKYLLNTFIERIHKKEFQPICVELVYCPHPSIL